MQKKKSAKASQQMGLKSEPWELTGNGNLPRCFAQPRARPVQHPARTEQCCAYVGTCSPRLMGCGASATLGVMVTAHPAMAAAPPAQLSDLGISWETLTLQP